MCVCIGVCVADALDASVRVDAGPHGPTAATWTALSALQAKGLRLEPFDDGAPPPALSAVPPSDTHLLSSMDFSRLEVLLARARAVVSPAAAYFKTAMEGKRGGQLARMKAVRFFNPLHVLASGEVTEADIDGLLIFRFSKHPKLMPHIEVGPSEAQTRGPPALCLPSYLMGVPHLLALDLSPHGRPTPPRRR